MPNMHTTKTTMTTLLLITLAALAGACAEEDRTVTLQGAAVLSDLYDADCYALAACGFGEPADHELCVDYKLTVGCSVADCLAFYEIPEREFERCLDDMLDRDCGDVERGVLPSSCVVLEEVTLTNPFSPWN
jgi:hypothetical protein